MAMDMGMPAGEAKQPPAPGSVGDELARAPYEPLLPIEIKLIVWSLITGAVLLVILCWSSYTFFK